MSKGQKLAGAAQRRTKWGFLHQGSIAVSLEFDSFIEGFSKALDLVFEPYRLSLEEQRISEQLMRTKYTLENWNRLRKIREHTTVLAQ